MVCRRCQKEKSPELMAKKRGKPSNTCKACQAEYMRTYLSKGSNRERQRVRSRAQHIRSRYGLSVDERDNMLSKPCEICKDRLAEVIDHCHRTGQVRGALCRTCNVGLGMLGDDVESLLRATEYLRR